jgi:hypothetical protein
MGDDGFFRVPADAAIRGAYFARLTRLACQNAKSRTNDFNGLFGP